MPEERKKQIEEACSGYSPDDYAKDSFIAGAEWADAHPAPWIKDYGDITLKFLAEKKRKESLESETQRLREDHERMKSALEILERDMNPVIHANPNVSGYCRATLANLKYEEGK
jgi:hypothetical protein